MATAKTSVGVRDVSQMVANSIVESKAFGIGRDALLEHPEFVKALMRKIALKIDWDDVSERLGKSVAKSKK